MPKCRLTCILVGHISNCHLALVGERERCVKFFFGALHLRKKKISLSIYSFQEAKSLLTQSAPDLKQKVMKKVKGKLLSCAVEATILSASSEVSRLSQRQCCGKCL